MKKLLITSLLTFILWISTVFASEIPVSYVSSPTNDCSASNTYHNFYLEWTKTVYPYDRFYDNTKDVKINPSSSLIKIWRWDWVVSNCDDWYLLSNVVPKKSTLPWWAYVWESPCDLNIPQYTKVNNPTKVDAQINYTLWYHNKKNSWWTLVSWKFFYQDYTADVLRCYPSGTQVSSSNSCSTTNFRYWDLNIHTWECVNFRVFRCGDGLVNSPYGSSYDNWSHPEQCDPNDPTHAGWNNNGYACNESCQLVIAQPVQPELSIVKEQISTWSMEAGSLVAYRITVRNTWSWPATGVVIYDLLPAELQYMTSSISITPNSTYLFATGTTQILGVSRTYLKYYNITLNANWTAIVYLTWKVKNWYTFETLTNCASVSWNNIQPEEDCVTVTSPTPTTCTITLSASQINLWESITVNYQISWSFIAPVYMEITWQLVQWNFPYPIYCNAQKSCQFTQWSTTIAGTSIPGIWTYSLWISWYSVNWDFDCHAIFNVVEHTWHGNVSIEKVLESVWPFSKWDQILYKIVAKNNWDATVIDSIWDIMPEAVTYLTSSIVFVPDSHQNYIFSTWISNGSFMFRYDNISLDPGQQAIIYLTWIINDNYIDASTVSQVTSTASHFYNWDEDCMQYWTNQAVAWWYNDITQNCAYTYTDGTGDNWSGTVTWSCVRFPKPEMIKYQSVRGMNFTRDQLSVAKNEVITYKVYFWNEYGEVMNNVKLQDVMPTCVEYISSQVYGIAGYWFSTWLSNNGNVLVNYQWFTLWSWQYGYMIVTWRISDSPSCQNTYVYRNDAYLIYSWWYINSFVIAKRPNVLLTKTWDGPHYNLSQPNTFYITVTNNSDDTVYDVALSEVDSWPTFSGCVNYIDWRGSNFTKDSNVLIWRYNGNLQPWQSISLIISWSIWSDASCVRDYINTVVLTYKDAAWNNYTLDAEYPFDVAANELALLTKVVDDHTVSINDVVTYTITYKNIWNVDWYTWYTLTDLWPSDVLTYLWSDCNTINTCSETRLSDNTIKFTFDSVLHPWETRTLILRWKVKIDRSNQKWNTVTLDYTTIFGNWTLNARDYIEYDWWSYGGNCGNGILEWNEECDGWYDSYLNWGSWDRFLIVNYLDYKRTTLAWDDAWQWYYCTQNCKKSRTNDSNYNIPSCLSVDTTISIMENELFPFWWRIWQRDGIKMVNWWNSKTCSNYSTSKNTVINRDTMKCTFSVYDGKSYNQGKNKALNTFTVNCFMDNNSSADNYFKPFDNDTCAFSRCVDFDKVAGRQVWNVVPTLLWNKWKWDTYGEYKLALEQVKYQYCAEDGTWKDGALYDAVCEVNFVLTKPYIMQVNTAWVPKATSSTFLDRFYDIAWNKIQTDLNNIVKVSESSYNVTQSVQSQITQFKNKYEKLAVQITNNWWWGVTSVKKVPNQSIYFVKWNWTLQLSKSNSVVSKAFTIVVDWMDVEIDGSILTNGMIITNKTMSFKDSDCTSWWQVVQWIFIAQGGFKKNESTLNQNTKAARCHRWNLHVKWVLIGSNINNIVNSKRSQLNSWFETELKYSTTNDSALKKERRNEIFQWASVLVEYNQNVWSKLIPWAEIFTETLDVYKK